MRKGILLMAMLALAAGHAAENGTAHNASFINLNRAADQYDPRLHAAVYAVEARQETSRAAAGFFYPQLSLASTYNATKRYTPEFTTQPKDYFQHRAIINQTVINRRRWYDYQAAEEEVRTETYNLESMRQAVYQEVIQARLDLHSAEERRLLLESRLQAVRERLTLVQRRQSGGIGTYLDVGLVEADFEQLKVELETAETETRNARRLLHSLTLMTVEELPRLREDFKFPLLPPLAALQSEIERRNPDIIRTRHQVETQRLRGQAALAEGDASLNLTGERGYSEETRNYFSFAVQLSVPIYTGGISRANFRSAQAQLRRLQYSLADTRRQVRRNTERLYNLAQSVIEQERRLRSTIAIQQELLDKTRLAWLEGVRLTQDVIDAEQNLFNSRLRQRGLYYSYMGLLTQLKQLGGGIGEPFLRQLDSYFEQ